MGTSKHNRRQREGVSRRLLGAALLAGAASLAGGCSKPLFSESYNRTQFDRYDRVRNQYAPQYVEDEFGHRQPNLRGRLSPKG